MDNKPYKNLDPRLVMPYWVEFLDKLGFRLTSFHDSSILLHWHWYTNEKTPWSVGLKSNHNYGDKTDRLTHFIFYNTSVITSYTYLFEEYFPFNLKIELELSIKALIHPNLLPLCLNFPWLQEVLQTHMIMENHTINQI